MRERFELYLCRIAWRTLWRYWPDRVYFHGAPGGVSSLTLVPIAATPVYEKLDHGGRRIR